jgi:hypothetical protein
MLVSFHYASTLRAPNYTVHPGKELPPFPEMDPIKTTSDSARCIAEVVEARNQWFLDSGLHPQLIHLLFHLQKFTPDHECWKNFGDYIQAATVLMLNTAALSKSTSSVSSKTQIEQLNKFMQPTNQSGSIHDCHPLGHSMT